MRREGRPFEVAWATADTAAALKVAYQDERDRAIRTRVHALWLLRSGWTLEAVAAAVGTHYRSVQRWVAWYRVGGVAAVRARKMGGHGQAPWLDEVAQAQVAAEVASGRFGTGAQIRDWIAERYGVVYTVAGIYSLLKRLKCSPKVPRPIHTKADPAQQAAFQKGGSRKRLMRRA